jgi:small-conductance mechanosensitive channel
MKDQGHKKAAVLAADPYAPRPKGSQWTYGLVGFTLAVLALLVIAGFFGLSFRGLLPVLAGITLAGAVAGILIHHRREWQNRRAVRSEYVNRE